MINTIHYFVDCETSGFCPKKNALLEVCIIKHVDRVEVDRLYLKIHPSNQDVIEPAALKCNGLKPSKWTKEEAANPKEAAVLIQQFFQHQQTNHVYFVCHNTGFDPRFIKGFGTKHGVNIKLPRMRIDTVHLAAAVLIPLGLENHKMDTIRAFIGLSSDGSHTATKDAEDVVILFNLFSPIPKETHQATILCWIGNLVWLARKLHKERMK
tara:strand:- start:1195 stop:1824 length:630 start_codon:yes stop_codon:yes gene_type:complete